MADVHVVVGGQFGSEGKGHFVAQLAKKLTEEEYPPMVIRTGGPNAGHTVLDDQGREWKLRHIPTAAVSVPESPIAIAPGAEIDVEVLSYEITLLETAGIPILDRLTVDAQATLLEDFHKQQESVAYSQNDGKTLVERIGSTGKGIGAARADRIMREAGLYGGKGDVASEAAFWLQDQDRPIVIEATQGFGLGLHAGWYPKCTSRDVRAIDALAEVGISPWQAGVDRVVVWVVFRPFPIRVAGDSGELRNETSWDDLGLEPEYTTVTQKIRRVGMWDPELAKKALWSNGYTARNFHTVSAVRPVMMFADYIDPTVAKLTEIREFDNESMATFQRYADDIEAQFWAYGTGPNTLAWAFDGI